MIGHAQTTRTAKTANALRLACLVLLGLSHDLALGQAGRVVAWGAGTNVASPPDFNNYGQSIVPASLTNAVFLAGGWRHSLAVRADGSLLGWGDDTLAQTNLPAGSNYLMVACGELHSLALRSDGKVSAAGDNAWGQATVPASLAHVVAIDAGFYHSLALTADGLVTAWGTSTNISQIGIDPSYGQAIVPGNLSNVVAVAAGGWHNLALKSDGTLAGWGRDDFGQADIPAAATNVVAIAAGAAHSLVLRADGTVFAWGMNTYGQTNVPLSLTGVVAIAAGGWHNLALKFDGTVVAWGAGGPSTNVNVACGQNAVPSGLSNVVQVAAGAVHSLALVGSAPPRLSAPLLNPVFATNSFAVTVSTHNGCVYRLQFKNSLNEPAWSGLPLKAGTGSALQFTDPSASAPQRFYRVQRW